MTRNSALSGRRGILIGALIAAVVAVVAGIVVYRSSHRAPTDCDTVHAMLEYNSQFKDQTKASAATGGTDPVSEQQYREWADRLRDYASRVTASGPSDRGLSGNATTAADLAGRLADLVPKYRANPDDKAVTREYAGIGIEFGNAINRLEYACLDAG